MEQKAFYELPKPPKKTFAVIVRQLPEKDTCQCQHGVPFFNKAGAFLGTLKCSDDEGEIYECACCGVETCEAHMSKTAFQSYYVCKGCEKLAPEDIEKIQKLRLELNH